MNHTVDTCPLRELEGGLNLLHEADDDAVIWPESTATAALARYFIITQQQLETCRVVCVQVCVRFHRQDSARSLTSRASSRARRDLDRRRERVGHVTAAGDDHDVKLPFPHEESQCVAGDEEECGSVTEEDDRGHSCTAVDCRTLAEQAQANIRHGVSDLEKVSLQRRKVPACGKPMLL